MTTDNYPIPSNRGGGEATPDDLAAEEAAQGAAAGQLTNIRSSAEKWAGAITTIVGLFTLSGLIKGPDDFAKVSSAWQPAIPVLLGVAVTAGLIATVLAARAAYGLPKISWLTGSVYVQDQARATATAARSLLIAIGSAIVSFALFALVVGVIWFAPRATASVSMNLVTTETTVVCGELKSISGSGLTIADTLTGKDVTIPTGSIAVAEPVVACPVMTR